MPFFRVHWQETNHLEVVVEAANEDEAHDIVQEFAFEELGGTQEAFLDEDYGINVELVEDNPEDPAPWECVLCGGADIDGSDVDWLSMSDNKHVGCRIAEVE